MYILHYAPDNASMIIRLVLEAADLPYRAALVDRRRREQDSPAYRALNPAGLIPTLETPVGPISETAAILLWLGERHGIGPGPGSPLRGALLRWLLFTSNTAHADLRQLFYPHLYVPKAAAEGHHALICQRMLGHFALLDRVAADLPVLFEPSGLLAPYVCALMRWSVLYGDGPNGGGPVRWFRLSEFSALSAVAQALDHAPQTRKVAEAEGLGKHPFTRPERPDPPEGSAT